MRDPYLVLFVVEPAEDEHADALHHIAHAAAQLHAWEGPEPRSFDATPAESDERTVGIALRIPERPAEADRNAIAALVEACATTGRELGVGLEVQLAEQRLGEIREGRADDPVLDALRDRLGLDME
ncbi:hypothetical protein [Conexibacter sp. SYSU D00693]|uniref:hypothetical protein n=1 Tax=Conexibacter sp. SYSU D00693 TaxID=2812560 RepID=UPI00196A42B1|nr:hypothetical protein [Conexibacter sp. SYSU D00693]